MNQSKIHNFLTKCIFFKWCWKKNKNLIKKKKIEKISDLLWNFPQGFTDRSNIKKLDKA